MRFSTDRKLHLTVSDEILIELGRIVVFQAQIESQIGYCISELLQIENSKGQIITSELSFKQLIGMLSSLILEKLGKTNPLYADFVKIKKKLHDFENFRNKVAHSVWVHGSDFSDIKAVRMKTTSKEKVGLQHQSEEVELKKLIEKLDAAGDTSVELVYLVAKISGKKIKQMEVTLNKGGIEEK